MRTCRPPNFGYSCGRWAAWQSFLDSWLPAVCQCYFSSRNGLKSSLCEAEGQQQKLPGTGTFQVDFLPEDEAYTKPGHILCASASLPDRKGHLICWLLQACASGKFCKTLYTESKYGRPRGWHGTSFTKSRLVRHHLQSFSHIYSGREAISTAMNCITMHKRT